MILVNDLKRSDNFITSEVHDAISRVLCSGRYILDIEVKTFEEEFANYCGVRYCIAVANGTDALELSLLSLGVGPGDEVITVGNAGMYSTIAIKSVGASPKYVEIDPVSMLMSPSSLKTAITKKTKVIIVTHLYGQMADIVKLRAIADSENILLLEDCAQAHGACFANKRAGSFGILGCFSFYPTKNLGAFGDAGAIVTDNEEIAKKLLRLRQYGWETKYINVLADGRNSRMDEIQAAVLRVKLKYIDQMNEKRRTIAKEYSNALLKLNLAVPIEIDHSYVAHLYVIRVKERDKLRNQLNGLGVMSEIHYPIPDYCQPIIANDYLNFSLPVTEKACSEVLTIPCFPHLTDKETKYIINSVVEILRNPYAQD